VTAFKLVPATDDVPEFAGFGAQYNQNVFAPVSREAGATEEYLRGLQQRLGVLRPQFVRVFFNGDAFDDPELMASFQRTLKLAQRTAATLNVTFQGIGPRAHSGRMPDFAALLDDLVSNQGISKLRWVTVRNEPNRPAMPKDLYRDLYRELDRELTRRGVRAQLRLMGGDLLINKQQEWFDFLATKEMADLLDAWSIHVYWDFWNPRKLVNRLTDVRTIWDALPRNRRKPLYVTEYGVRGKPGPQKKANPGFLEDERTPLRRTNINAFQHAWFSLLAADLGYRGTVKWDAYFGRYGTGEPAKTMAFASIGHPADPHPSPIFELMRLLALTIGPGARVARFTSDAPEGKLVVGFSGPAERLSVVGLDTNGAVLNATSPRLSTYVLEGLPESTSFLLRSWNHGGKGRTVTRGRLRSDSSGSLPVRAPIHSVFAITSIQAP
jgi:hypothetical protein